MTNIKKSYEAVLVFSVKSGEEETAANVKKFNDLIEKNATVDSVDEWGKRKLAYLIDKETEGYYVLYKFTSDPSFPAELERICKITEGVLREMVICIEE